MSTHSLQATFQALSVWLFRCAALPLEQQTCHFQIPRATSIGSAWQGQGADDQLSSRVFAV